jgi:hypothetical protein
MAHHALVTVGIYVGRAPHKRHPTISRMGGWKRTWLCIQDAHSHQLTDNRSLSGEQTMLPPASVAGCIAPDAAKQLSNNVCRP